MPKSKFTNADHTFRILLKEFRITKNLSQAEVAVRLGLPQSYVSKYENGERRLDFVETALVCEALGIDIETFTKTYSGKLTKTRRTKGA